MGDRTPIEVIVYSCPPERVNAVLEVFEEFGLGHEFVLPGDPAPGPANASRQRRLELGRGYIHSEISVGSSAEIAAALPSDAAWKVWEDPAYEHLGEVHLNHPDLGVFLSDCDAQGRPMFNSGEVDALIELTGGDRVQLGHHTGRTWEMALEQLHTANNGIVLERHHSPGLGSAAGSRTEPARVRPGAVAASRRTGPGPFYDRTRSLALDCPIHHATGCFYKTWSRSQPWKVGSLMNTLTISSHDELISYVPHLLRFHPEGMVCVPIGGGPVSRLDLPPSPRDMEPFLQTLSDVYLRRHPTQRIALLAYGDDGKACIEALSALGDRLVSDHRGPDVGPMLWVDGEQWFDVLDGTSGTVDPAARARMDAEFALMGQVRPSGSREDLAAAMQGDPSPVAEHLPAAGDRVMKMDLSALKAEIEWLGSRLDEFTEDRQPLSNVDAARVLAVIHDSGARNEAETRMTRANAPVYTELWHNLVRRAPEEVRDTPAAMLALSSYLDGKGAQAWVALDQITERLGRRSPTSWRPRWSRRSTLSSGSARCIGQIPAR